MTNTLLFDFTVDKETNTIHLTREFAADVDLVWDAFTKAEILDQWVAPKPWRAKTKEMDFREGGRWLYTMLSPDDTLETARNFSLVDFVSIAAKTSFTSRNSFADQNGDPVNPEVYSMTDTIFTEGEQNTTVHIVKKMNSLAQLEKFVSMGFKEGMAAAMINLDDLLASLSRP